jgi:putative membrane protein
MILKTSRPFWYLFKTIRWQFLLVVVLCIAMGEIDTWLLDHYGFDFPIAIPAFMGTAIVFILAFRTNQAYDRWWEARKVWGAIINDSRSWTRMVLNLISVPEDSREAGEELKRRLLDRQIGWNYILTARLREKEEPLKDMGRYFNGEEYEFIKRLDNPNQGILILQSRDLKTALDRGWVEGLHHIEMEECLKAMESCQGKVERIKNTHFPVLYDHLILFSIFLFSLLLTYAIVDRTTWFEVTFSVTISTIFLALEKIASDMQDPFEDLPTDTPITQISYTIERGILQMAGETEMPAAPKQGKFYIK